MHPDVAGERCLIKDRAAPIDVTAHETIAASSDVKCVRIGESHRVVVRKPCCTTQRAPVRNPNATNLTAARCLATQRFDTHRRAHP